MTFNVAGFVHESSDSTGNTGAIALTGAVPGANTFAGAIGGGNRCLATIVDGGTGKRMVCDCLVNTIESDSLSIQEVFASSDGFGTRITLSPSTHHVFIGPVAGKATGDKDYGEQELKRPQHRDYGEVRADDGSIVAGVYNPDFVAGNDHRVKVAGNMTFGVPLNPPPGTGTMSVEVASGGSFVVTFDVAIDWGAAGAPTLTTGRDLILLRATNALGGGNITGITQANPAVVTSASHGLASGDKIYYTPGAGMTELAGGFYRITVVDANNFSLDGVNSAAFTAYVSGGTWKAACDGFAQTGFK